jgi:CheY-specific phosphatase CheX
MYDELRKAAISSVLNIFETMFFTFLEPLDEHTGPEATDTEQPLDRTSEFQNPGYIKSEIHFVGIHSGVLRLFLPYDFSRVLAMNFMGFEEEVSESQIKDMAGELTNMVCGNLFSSLNKTTVYTLSPPATQKISLQEKVKEVGPEDFLLDFRNEGHHVTLAIHFES